MGQFYTVQSANRLDGTDNYGNVTDSIQFDGVNGSVLYRHQPSTVIEAGKTLFGHIETKTSQNNKQYQVFKREQQEQQSGSNYTQPTPSTGGYSKGSSNSDGMRQGMCINNAANFVNLLVDATSITPESWAKEVHAYASALYALGDLGQTPQVAPVQDVVVEPTDEMLNGAVTGEMLEDIDKLFPGTKKVN